MHNPWLWPDHVIGKRESRRLREDHNAVVNLKEDLLEACRAALDVIADPDDHSGSFERMLRDVIAKAEGR